MQSSVVYNVEEEYTQILQSKKKTLTRKVKQLLYAIHEVLQVKGY